MAGTKTISLAHAATKLRRPDFVEFGRRSPKHRAAVVAELARRLEKTRRNHESILRELDQGDTANGSGN